nr:hypothetical protein [Nitrosomonas nitrosa]
MTSQPDSETEINVALLSEILREFTPYRVMRAHQDDSLGRLLADQLPHESWYYDALVISTAYRLLNGATSQADVERKLLAIAHPETQDEK